MVDRADLILVMDRHNEAALLARYPAAASKVHLIGAVGGAGPMELPDPFHYGDLAAIRRCCQLVDECVRALPGRLGLLPWSGAGPGKTVSSAPVESLPR
jgi:protein-tyrosine-phosphatase